jgi:hypothetical protein
MNRHGFTSSLVHPAATLLFYILPAWRVAKWVAWVRWPAWVMAAAVGAITALLTAPAQAGWFWGPDPKVEAANRALERAAEIATDAARTQSGQQSQLLAAIEALSSERAQIAGQLGRLGELAARDSAWAAALQAAGPVLVAVVVLALGCAAIWMVTRASNHDSDLATVLVSEIAGTGASEDFLLRQPHRGALPSRSGQRAPGLEHVEDYFPESLEDEEVPFQP